MSSSIVYQTRQNRRLVEEENLRRLENKLYQLEPMEWLKNRFGEDPLNFQWSLRPAYANKKVPVAGNPFDNEAISRRLINNFWDGSVDPLYNAWQDAANRHRRIAIEAATATSKTYFLSRLVFWFLDVYPNSLVVTSAPKQQQLSLQLWSEIASAFHKFKRIRPNASLYNLRLVVDDTKLDDFDPSHPNTSKSWHAVGFVAGVGTIEDSATKAQGFHRPDMLIITEETPGMPEPVMTAFKNTSTGGNNIIFSVGNPDSQLDPLHRLVELPDTRAYRISAYDYPNIVEKKEVVPGAVTIQSVKSRLGEYGAQSDMYKSRIRGIAPKQGTDSLIKLDWCKAAVAKTLPYDGTYHAVGVDVANSIDGDKACLAWGKGQILCELHEFQCPNANHLAYNIIMSETELGEHGYADYGTGKAQDYEIMEGMIGVDGVGVGVGTINTLMDMQWNPVSLQGGQWDEAIPLDVRTDDNGKEIIKPKYRFQGLRSQMYWEAREDLRQGLIHIAIEDKVLLDKLFKELVTIRVKYKDNFIAVEPKEEIKKRLGGKSPNMADAFVYWNWTRKGYRLAGGFMPIVAGG